ncbi:U5 small nuclear ribonucleoprotein 40 kDa protein [Trichinella britovi]|uniref:U5 small nuclear ribonucleoprotein 40 kDa protein n=3 Tax=Trichinella TaxID=6333 RepID=A0A0V1D1B6_TRIBR|nr:U5 small nuclear ribonucleoprotein 40 kDa protein [Trichinella britovi]
MTRHQKNATASTVYSYHERKKDQKASGYGTLEERLEKAALKDFDCCSLTLQRCKDPVVNQDGYLFEYEAILKYILHQKKEIARKSKLYANYLEKKQQEEVEMQNAEYNKKVQKFVASEATPARRMNVEDDSSLATTSTGLGNQKSRSFWVPGSEMAKESAVEKPDTKVLCPVTGKELKMKNLTHIKFTVANGIKESEVFTKKDVYVCALTGDILTNSVPCAVLKTSGNVITVSALEKVVKKDMTDPFNGRKLTDKDIILLQRGGTGFAATNEKLNAKLSRPIFSTMMNHPGNAVAIARPSKPHEVVHHSEEQKRSSHLMAPIMSLIGHEGEIYAAAFSYDGTMLASGGFDQKIFLWNVYGECENFALLSGHNGAIMELHFSADNNVLFTCSTDKTVRLWDMETGVCIRNFKGHTSFVNSCHPARRGPQLVCSGSDDGTIKVWDRRQKKCIYSFENVYQVTAVTFNDTAEQIVSGGIENDLKIWDIRKESPMFTLRGHGDTVTGLSLSPDGSHVLSNAMDCTVRIWDIRPFAPVNRCVAVLQGAQHNFEKNLLRCAWSPDGMKASSGSADRFVYIWDLNSRRVQYKLPGHFGSVNVTAFHPCEPIVWLSKSNCIFENLAFEHWLLLNGDFSNRDGLLIWRNRPAVVIGRHQNPWLEVNLEWAKEADVDLARRHSGGGAVYHDMQNMNVSFLTTNKRYNRLKNLSLVRQTVERITGLQLAINEKHDLLLFGHKISGTAAKLTSNAAYHHLTVMLDVNLKRLSLALNSNIRGVLTNATESRRSSVISLRQFQPELDYDQLVEAVVEDFARNYESCQVENVLHVDDGHFVKISDNVEQLKSWNWRFGQSPKFVLDRVLRPRSQFECRLRVTVVHGLIERIELIKKNQVSATFSEAALFTGIPFDTDALEQIIVSAIHSLSDDD